MQLPFFATIDRTIGFQARTSTCKLCWTRCWVRPADALCTYKNVVATQTRMRGKTCIGISFEHYQKNGQINEFATREKSDGSEMCLQLLSTCEGHRSSIRLCSVKASLSWSSTQITSTQITSNTFLRRTHQRIYLPNDVKKMINLALEAMRRVKLIKNKVTKPLITR
jgi:hypothetical protein